MTSQNFSKHWWLVFGLPLWVYGVFMAVQFALAYVIEWLVYGVGVPLATINPVVFNLAISAIVYGLAAVAVIWLPWKLWRQKTTRDDLGVTSPPSWLDGALVVPVMIGYLMLSGVVMALLTPVLPIDLNQEQVLPINAAMLTATWHYIMAFIMLVVLAPVGEELLFRGYLYGKLRKIAPIWVAIAMASLTFGVAHLWTGGDGPLQWAVMIDTFVLSLVMCVMREHTGAIWITILMHMVKNGLAFYLLFVNPQIVEQIKAAILPLL